MRKLILTLAFILIGVVASFAQIPCFEQPLTIYGKVNVASKAHLKGTRITLYRFVDFVADEPITVTPNIFGYYKIYTKNCGLTFIIPSHTGKALPFGATTQFNPEQAFYDFYTLDPYDTELNFNLTVNY